ncbi:MAG: hypothetical protein A3E01_16130 [Gammaproteobacteria bacterium RIFCSPHIGHO2_12_FULL_63_22]|nr:MAG: hypothetical protein A3E01_16130 [Gammaproteobacteria bacterium RIFCSPHIGHO2_12_FULL_63_22]
MTDIDPRTLDLIHAELDDELDAAGRAELSTRLAADPQARLQYDQLTRMAQSLARLPPMEPPAGLRQRWQPSPPAPAPLSPRVAAHRRWLGRGVALAAATLAVAFGLSFTDIGRQSLDGQQLMGTMGSDTPAASDSARIVPVEAPGLSGTVALEPGQSGWDLVFKLDTAGPVSVSATYDPAALRLEGYARAGSGDRSFTASPGRIGFVNQGAEHLSLHLLPGEGGQVRIRFEGQEGTLQDMAITVPAGAPPK